MDSNTLSLNKRRLRYANDRGQYSSGFNCWGATLFVLNAIDRLKWIEYGQMQQFLDVNTKPIHRPRKVGDIVAVHGYVLNHTAVYLGNGKYFHKRGMNSSEITDLAGVKRIYRGRYSWYRPIERSENANNQSNA